MTIPGIPHPAVPYGSWVVISGATGFIGSHVVDQALAAGYKVRGTTRSVDRGAWAKHYFGEKYGEAVFDLVQVKDMALDNAFDEAVTGASGFIHVANDMTGSSDSQAISLAVSGALNALKACSKAGIKRFVYTSSSFAVTQPKPNQVFEIAENTFNEEAVEKVRKGTANGEDVYCASKVEAERALRSWGKEHAPEVVINMVNPNANLGPVLSPSNQGYPTTAKWVKLLWEQNYAAFEGFQPQHYINVQDDAKLHIIALANPEVTGERIFGMTAPCTLREIVGILRELYPDRKWEEAPDIGEDKIVVVPKKRAEELLRQAYGSGFIGLKETVKANLVGLA